MRLCFGLELWPLAAGCRLEEDGLWGLVTAAVVVIGDIDDVAAKLCETTAESVCAWNGIDGRVRDVGVGMGEDIGDRTGLRPDSGEAEGGVLEALALGLCG